MGVCSGEGLRPPPRGGGGAEGPGRVRSSLPHTFPHPLPRLAPEGRRLGGQFQAEGQLGSVVLCPTEEAVNVYSGSWRLPVSPNPRHWKLLFPECCQYARKCRLIPVPLLPLQSL